MEESQVIKNRMGSLSDRLLESEERKADKASTGLLVSAKLNEHLS